VQNNTDAALAALRGAIEVDPLNPLARYEHAAVLLTHERYADAITELEKLKARPALDCLTQCTFCLVHKLVADQRTRMCIGTGPACWRVLRAHAQQDIIHNHRGARAGHRAA
jgi:hypothetical protein